MIFLRYILTAHLKHAKRDVKGLYKKARSGRIKILQVYQVHYEHPKILILVKTMTNIRFESIDYLFEQLKSKL